jgi:hypothetical protein
MSGRVATTQWSQVLAAANRPHSRDLAQPKQNTRSLDRWLPL